MGGQTTVSSPVTDVVIVSAVRSAIGKLNGTLAHTHPADLLGQVQMECLRRVGLDGHDVDQVLGGCLAQVGAQSWNITRAAWLSHGGDPSTPCSTIDAMCGSSQQAINLGYSLIASGVNETVLACGVESLSIVPVGSNALNGPGRPLSRSYFRRYEAISQFESAERLAGASGISRTEADAYGLESQLRTAAAQREGRFETQIAPIDAALVDANGTKTGETVEFSRDEVARDTSMEALSELEPLQGAGGIHTVGTFSRLADASAAVLLMSAERAASLGLRARARVAGTELVGSDPVMFYSGLVPATERALEREGLSVGDVDVYEVNEAFAAAVIAWRRTVDADPARVNPNGGAIAQGHPFGATGCILTTKSLHELERIDGNYGLVVVACAGGLAVGTLIQRLR